jgi:hypothetical protein
VIAAAGVLDLGKYYQNAELANSMHNMLSIGIDYGRALNIKSVEINTSKKFEYEGRMRYIYNKPKREQYGKIIETALGETQWSELLTEASALEGILETQMRSAHVVNNKCKDKEGPRVKLDGWMQGYLDARTGETYGTDSGGENDILSDIELSKEAIGEKLDAAMACLNQVVKAERNIGLSRTS